MYLGVYALFKTQQLTQGNTKCAESAKDFKVVNINPCEI